MSTRNSIRGNVSWNKGMSVAEKLCANARARWKSVPQTPNVRYQIGDSRELLKEIRTTLSILL